MKGAIFGGVVDDARVRWQNAEAEAVAARAAALGNPDPEVNRRANALTKIAADMLTQFKIAESAHEEGALTPIRSINVKRMREQRLGASSPPLGTLAILLSPLAVAGVLVWRRSR